VRVRPLRFACFPRPLIDECTADENRTSESRRSQRAIFFDARMRPRVTKSNHPAGAAGERIFRGCRASAFAFPPRFRKSDWFAGLFKKN
jgi:hypothetical protein